MKIAIRWRTHQAVSGIIPIICGPTASGKTSWAIGLGERTKVEIVSADSRQVYRHLDIGTAKPTAAERKQCPHHLIDFLELRDHYSSGQFVFDAEKTIRGILAGGSLPVVVGGSGLYLKALQEGLCEVPPVSSEIRESVRKEYDQLGPEKFHRVLTESDAKSAAIIHPGDWKKACRAMEVFRQTGKPLSQWQAQEPQTPAFNFLVILIQMERETLYERINARVDRMVEAGLFDEARELLDRKVDPKWNSLHTVAYPESFAYLRGEIDKDTCIGLIKQHTRNFAKRQLTWFKKAPVDIALTRQEELVPAMREAGIRFL